MRDHISMANGVVFQDRFYHVYCSVASCDPKLQYRLSKFALLEIRNVTKDASENLARYFSFFACLLFCFVCFCLLDPDL